MVKYILLFSTALTLSACDTFRDYDFPTFFDRAEQVDLADGESKLYQAQQPVSAWWYEFNDIMLADLVDQALETNLDIRIAAANLAEARALRSAVGYDRFPIVTSNASYTRSMQSQEATGAQSFGDRYRDTYEAGFDAGWELDLFGRVSNRIQAQEALAELSLAELQSVYVSVAAEVARNYMELRGAQYQLDIAQRNANNQQETYDITRKLVEGGRGNSLDTSRARTQLDLTKATIPPLQTRVDAAINRLSVLTGQVPGALRDSLGPRQKLPTLPVSVAVGDAEGLLRRRPDIYAAERQLAVATANYNLAVAELFPSVSLLGSIGYVATDLSSFGASALAGSVGPSLSWRAFDLGRVRSEIKASDSRSQSALLSYEQTVLEALEETKTSLTEFRNEEDRRRTLQSAARAAKNAAYVARQRYNEGVDDFLVVLDAERTLLDAENALAVSETTSATDLVSVYKALGGGWQVSSESDDAQNSSPRKMGIKKPPQ